MSTSVYERNLVSTDIKAKDIVTEHWRYCDAKKDQKIFKGDNLVYVTPVSIL